MNRRHWLQFGCAHCLLLATHHTHALDAWTAPERFVRPPLDSDEGGLWGLLDREEVQLRRSPFLLEDVELRRYLQDIACRLGAKHCPDIRTYAVRTPWFNASMAANGMMQVWSGLLLRCDNESQLAAVIGHEIGHYLERHNVQQLQSAKSRTAWGQLMTAIGGPVGLVAALPLIAGALAFSRDQERDADRIGVVLMRNAGYDPREAPKIWDNLLAELRASEGNDPSRKSILFASHPPTAERRDTLASLAGDGGGTVGTDPYERILAPSMRLLLGDELKRARYDESIALLDRKVLVRPECADFLYFRAEAKRLRAQQGDAEASLMDLQDAVRLGNEPPETHRALGLLHQQMGQNEGAAIAFSRYLELAPAASDRAMIESYLTELRP